MEMEPYDEVDQFLAKEEGKVERKDLTQLCHHGPRQKCSNCLPIDPYDEDYLKSKDIKHMSFHAYVRKLTDLHGKGTQLKKPLENVNCFLDLNCTNGHKPYPKGICTKCRPPTLTLNRQIFRHVDNITIENEDVVNRFLDFWRRSSHQRVGYLIGRYEPFLDVPLGIKAIVTAIYEPPQNSTESSVNFEQDPNDEAVDKLCEWLGMRRVGWIFSDLWAEDPQAGTVHCTRHEKSFLMSAKECITAGAFQGKYKNLTQYCNDKYFGSKFVTVVASGDKDKHVNFHGYQVSNQCSAMVEAQILCPTSHPELAWVRETPLHDRHYITDEKNEYGAEVRKNGRPMPVEYLLVDVPTGMPKEPSSSFHVSPADKGFVIENRTLLGQVQDMKSVAHYVLDFSPNQFLECASNFHFLLYLLTNDVLKFSDNEVAALCKILSEHDRAAAMEWAEKSENWATFMELLKSNNEGTPSGVNGINEETTRWSCKHCTFENTEPRSDCAVCGLPAS
ncbi:NPL4 domain containing protein [Aphelenchoides besseyi]|nr:NPL4 domain containing protein [Aphelenchoides besseyi]